jgi:hypothetical protein
MKHEEALVRVFFQPAPASVRKWEQAEAILQAAEEARWRLRRLLGTCEIVRAALRGERPPTRWEVIPVRSRKQRAARVGRAEVRKEAAPSGPDVASPAEPPPAVPVVGAGVPLGLTAWRQASGAMGSRAAHSASSRRSTA